MCVLRGGLFVPSMMIGGSVHTIRQTAYPSQRLIDMITPPLPKIGMDAFSPPVEQETSVVSRTPEVLFQAFVNVLVKVSQDVFVGEGCDVECAESKLAGKNVTICAAEHPEDQSEYRENITFRKVVEIARTEPARERAETVSTGTLSLEQRNSIS